MEIESKNKTKQYLYVQPTKILSDNSYVEIVTLNNNK